MCHTPCTPRTCFVLFFAESLVRVHATEAKKYNQKKEAQNGRKKAKDTLGIWSVQGEREYWGALYTRGEENSNRHRDRPTSLCL